LRRINSHKAFCFVGVFLLRRGPIRRSNTSARLLGVIFLLRGGRGTQERPIRHGASARGPGQGRRRARQEPGGEVALGPGVTDGCGALSTPAE